MNGGDGNDTYLFGKGSGQDTINDFDRTAGETDTVLFAAGIAPSGLLVRRVGDDLVLFIRDSTDKLTLQNYMSSDGTCLVEQIKFADSGVVWDVNTVKAKLALVGTNHAPVLSVSLLDQNAAQGGPFSYTLPASAFTDPDAEDAFSYSATLADGSALPSWLYFDAATRTFSGMPDTLGTVSVQVVASDSGNLSASDVFDINVSVQNLSLSGTAGADTLTGGSGDDVLTGLAGMDSLIGNAGNDRLDGGLGADTLTGGLGNDTYIIDDAGDVVSETSALAGEIDRVESSITYALGANLENLILTGTTAINGTGNALNNTLTGNSAANTLSGGAGADTLIGGAGDDTYVVDHTGDIVTENASEGIDLAQAGVTYTLVANVENLTLTGTAALNGTGNALDNVLTGNSAVNTLTGGAGNDTLNGGTGADKLLGGLGDDTYSVDNTSDVVTENASEGTDLINSSVTLTLAANVEALVLTGTSAINGTGNTLNNLVRGNSAVNTLNGGTGNDILEGGAGNDILTDTSGTALFNGGIGADTITGGTSAEVYLGGAGNDTYTTGAGNDVILFNKGDGQDTFATGGTGSDTLSLGGAFAYSDLTFSKSSSDLVLKMGTTDQITFKNWYAATPSKPVVNLQVIAEAMAGFALGGANPLLDQKVEEFNFTGLVSAFDAARTATPTLTSWALTNALTNFQLASSSNTAAYGGDLAYQYGANGTLAGIGLTAAQDVIGNTNLGTQTQTLQPLSGLQAGAVRLS